MPTTLDKTRREIAERDELLTREQAAEYLGVKSQTLAVWATTGRYDLPFVRVGRCVRYRLSALERFLNSRTVSTTGEADSL